MFDVFFFISHFFIFDAFHQNHRVNTWKAVKFSGKARQTDTPPPPPVRTHINRFALKTEAAQN